MTRQPPTSTLFPYTTLFRSVYDSTSSASRNDSTSVVRTASRFSATCVLYGTFTATRTFGFVPTSRLVAACVVGPRSEEHTSELQSRENLVCRLLLEKKK